MNHLIKIIVIILVIVFGSTVSFAFQNEPDGFREIKWGSTDEVGGKGYRLYKDEGKHKLYKRNFEDDVFYRDGNKVKAFRIIYYTFDGKFREVRIFCKLSDWNAMKKILISLHGSPTGVKDKDDNKAVRWLGQTAVVGMIYQKKKDRKKEYFSVTLSSVELYKEYDAWKKAKKSESGG